ncbi:MAG: YihY/virulence factor BrkB family protein [Solirubrobacterales bacterium]
MTPNEPNLDDPTRPPRRRIIKVVYGQLDIAFSRFSEHKLTDWAAALTYYSMLSIFPGLLVLVSILGLMGQSVTGSIIENFEELAPNAVRDVFLSAIRGLQESGTTAGVLLFIGLFTAVYSASSYIGAYIRAAGIVLAVRDERPFYKTLPLRLGLTALLMTLLLIAGLAIVLTGPVAREVAHLTGVSDDGTGGWDYFKWPFVIALAVLALAILYNLGPDHEEHRFRLVTPGIILAVTLWLLLSFAFSLYVGSFARYNKVYGSLAGVIIFLVWLWLTNIAVLFGLEFDAELRRFKRVHGHSAFSRQRF